MGNNDRGNMPGVLFFGALAADAPSLRDSPRATGGGRPSGRGGGRGKYSSVDGDLPGAAEYLMPARTDVPAQAVAHRCRGTENGSSSPTAAPVTKISGLRASCRTEPADTNILHVNIQGWRSHMAELCAVIRIMTAAPDVVCVNETFLDKGVEDVQLEGYLVVGRRDRSYSGDERRCGGIIVFARTEIAEHVTLMSMSDSSERMWILMHTHLGLLCCWYRPPLPGEVQSILDFETECNQLKDGALGMVLLGDLNLHSRR